MNKKFYFSILFCFFVFLAVGYKIGDYRGFQAGFQEGYTFDCQNEIKALKATHDDLKRAVKVQEELVFRTQKRLDSVAYSEIYGERDSLLHVKYIQDSIINWRSAARYNDSLSRLNINSPRKCPNGEISSTEKLLVASGYNGKFTGKVLGCR